MEKIRDILVSKIDTLNDEEQKILKKLISKLKSFAHAPLNRKHCLRMAQFIESEKVTRLVADVIQPYELKLMPNGSFNSYDVIGYYYGISLLTCCVVFEKGDSNKAYAVLENEVIKENEKNTLVAERGGENYYVMARILNIFKMDKECIDSLYSKLSNASIQ
ncbi:hypothetical protein A6283_23545 [Bacillus wiedmannii]|uniref:hypothetical protein n=1 Tax=Bacillus TaxID=1386 RepID=UPI0007CAA95D|nr:MULTISPECIES: hypothetical protein [Bacillus cereus group]RFB09336.1 hypothetical protein DZB88_26760 [Bacillus sp. OE]OAK29166.1 hypothetical protein A6283_23545 [Bacillus wiedmannii]OAK37750.1 hypothetical protein A6284_25065 [Bacillus wiedmannii]OAK41168.1 hypothetical protein A6285_23855 [Bacillus wiedmannii]OFD51478.1 hypothetical protein BWGOE3_09830 [Bacillus mycoides]